MNLAKIFSAFFAVFFFLFAPRLAIGGGVSTGMLAVLCVVALAIKARRRITIPLPLLYVGACFVLFALYSTVMASIYGNNPVYFISICLSVTVSLVFSWFFAELVSETGLANKELVFFIVTLMAWAIFVNSLVIVLEYLFPPLKTAVEAFLYLDETANINYADHPFRFRGLASAGGASLSIINAVGVLLIIFLFFSKKMGGALGILLALVMVVSNIFTGRTGLIFGIVFFAILLALVLTRLSKSGLKGLMGVVLFAVVCALFMQYALSFQLDPEVALWAFEWVEGLTSGQVSSSSSDDLGTMLFLPTNVVHLFLGIGFFEGEGRIYPRSDSGYVKSILTLGLVGSLFLYALIGKILLDLRKVDKCFVWLILPILAFLLIVEIKEPFMYQNFAARVVFLLSGTAMFLLGKSAHAHSTHNYRA